MTETQLRGCEYLLAETDPAQLFTPEDFSDEHKQIAETTEQFVSNEVLPHVEEIDAQNFGLTVGLLQKCGELGLLMIDGPLEYGGLDLDKVTSMLVAEKIGVSGAFATTSMGHTGIGTLPLVYYGTPEQKECYLDKLMTAEMIGAYCLSEPGAGSDALGVKTTATLSDDGKYYILNGTKQFISNAAFADLFTVFAKVDKQHFTGFLIERGFPGVIIGPEEKKLGIKGSSTCQLILDNAQVPVENLLGEIGKGHKIAFNILNVGRFKLGAGVTGAAKHAFAEGARYANERKQFGASISSFGAIKEKLADMTAGIFASESVVYRLAGLLDERLAGLDKGADDYYKKYQKGIEEYAAECAIAKVFCTEVQAFVADEVLQIHGGYGFINEYPAERFYRDARISRIYEGTNEINRILIPGIVLGKGSKDELPLQAAIKESLAVLKTAPTDSVSDEGPFAEERQLLKRLKSLFLVIVGSAIEKYQDCLQQEQEILMTVADIAIHIFALESAVLRAEKAYVQASLGKKDLYLAVARVCAYKANEQAVCAAQKGAFYIAGEERSQTLLSAVQRFGQYDASGLLSSKRALAEAASEAEGYIF
jgi:alkylation response protein AidB-like acyl-CoA dehydrogenase